MEARYTRFDGCDGKWPIEDKSFDLGYNPALIEDVRDAVFNPIQHLLRETAR
jgi:hypothetical protein